ncbi:hypothetical protein CPC08DRAFT_71032 [Agrocybe pediades]|nr:hypothetical protein CPC08DRAFT_71032 [Agrocybe pediades]
MVRLLQLVLYLFKACAVFLGRLGGYDVVLERYVYRLRDCLKAEEQCKRIHLPSSMAESSLPYLTYTLRSTV